MTPLMNATYSWNYNLVKFSIDKVAKYLVENVVDANAKTDIGVTALMFASQFGNLDIVKYLLKKRGDINAFRFGGTKRNRNKIPFTL